MKTPSLATALYGSALRYGVFARERQEAIHADP
jgi:hypothetical protein